MPLCQSLLSIVYSTPSALFVHWHRLDELFSPWISLYATNITVIDIVVIDTDMILFDTISYMLTPTVCIDVPWDYLPLGRFGPEP